MSKKDLVKKEPEGQGRPAFADEQYDAWIDAMEPWLELGQSLYYSCEMAGIKSHYWVILEKYKSEKWFSQKVDALRAKPGDLINNTVMLEVKRINNEVKTTRRGLDRDEIALIKLAAEKHRSAQPFFVTRAEVAQSDDKNIGKILDAIDSEDSDYDELGQAAQKQMVAANPSIQDKGQDGEDSNLQAEHPATETPSGESEPPVQSDS